MQIPPREEWLTVKQVATLYEVTPARVYRAYQHGRRSLSGHIVKLQVFRSFGGVVTTKKFVEDFLMKLNG